MTEEASAALRCAVNIARNQGVEKVGVLRVRVEAAGFTPEATDEALKFWANYERTKNNSRT